MFASSALYVLSRFAILGAHIDKLQEGHSPRAKFTSPRRATTFRFRSFLIFQVQLVIIKANRASTSLVWHVKSVLCATCLPTLLRWRTCLIHQSTWTWHICGHYLFVCEIHPLGPICSSHFKAEVPQLHHTRSGFTHNHLTSFVGTYPENYIPPPDRVGSILGKAAYRTLNRFFLSREVGLL